VVLTFELSQKYTKTNQPATLPEAMATQVNLCKFRSYECNHTNVTKYLYWPERNVCSYLFTNIIIQTAGQFGQSGSTLNTPVKQPNEAASSLCGSKTMTD